MSNAELRDRVMDESGNLVHVGNPRKKLEGEKREQKILREKILNLESALKFKRSEIQSLKQQLKEQNPALKQEIATLRKENSKLLLNIKALTEDVQEETPVEEEKDKKAGFFGGKK